jgi:hypothetical protein
MGPVRDCRMDSELLFNVCEQYLVRRQVDHAATKNVDLRSHIASYVRTGINEIKSISVLYFCFASAHFPLPHRTMHAWDESIKHQ